MAWFRRGRKNDDTQASEPSGAEVVDARAGDAPVADAPDEMAPIDHAVDAEDVGRGPYDAADVTDPEGYVRLGAVWIPAFEGLMLTFEMDQTQSQVAAVQVVLGDSTLQLQAFAAPKSSGIWDEIRTEIAEGIAGRGGTATEEQGDFGTELVVSANGTLMRFLGCDGPRWFLRGVLSGRAAQDPSAAAPLRTVFAHVVVDRGHEPMGPRELLALRLPDDGVEAPSEADARSADDLDPFTRGPEITEIR
ncbi:DUF3710 domain-containing protein [Mobilicoccus pelagius]|uniref:DUF3710 domain-containing protein n=1 Tax=Mobilicoccus pelagius NBRC 104925 TaxID=1089455 RepID=H5UUM5_9MICO|nr:DUF3710 domain-containing protein [Mobilicoccus pelagius]GAB49433.1 hypothetical protein MOPEL_130_00400 [Mobilicoccus pelagius NBRC 104925]